MEGRSMAHAIMSEHLDFLTDELVRALYQQFGSPTYVYNQQALIQNARAALAFPNAFGLTVRFAMKAAPNASILRGFQKLGLHIDASSGFEVKRAIRCGIEPGRISLSTQEFPSDFADLHAQGIQFNACSLNQLEAFGKLFPGQSLGLRFNPGVGSGGSLHTNVGGPSSSFGIWHEDLPKVQECLSRYDLKAVRVHTHIGSGSDPEVWQRVAALSLGLLEQFPEATILNLGGGYKVGRVPGEKTTDLQVVGTPVQDAMVAFAERTGRRIHLEIEPGTFLVANACALLTRVQDMTRTGEGGFNFLKLDAGMTEILRPSLYGSQHPFRHVSQEPNRESYGTETVDYVIVGHCCESGDLLSPMPDKPAALKTIPLPQTRIGDFCLIGGAGAYCSSMSTKNYNSFPEAAEVMVDSEGKPHCIRERQSEDQLTQNEVLMPVDIW